MPAQGSGDSARTGNDIYGIGWTVRMQLRLPTDRLNGKVRMVILQVPKGYDPGATYTNVFDNVTGHVLLDPINSLGNTLRFIFSYDKGRDFCCCGHGLPCIS